MTTPCIKVINASVHFGGLKAIDNLSIDIFKNQITGIIGPNGAGKTTLISAITGFVPIVTGTIRYGKAPLSSLRPEFIAREGIVRTFQIPAIAEDISVQNLLNTVIINTNSRAIKYNLESAEDISNFCSINHLLDKSCNKLSLPQLRRLEIARVLSCGPDFIFLDETMAGLGELDISETLKLIRKIFNLGIGIIMIEHMMNVIKSICDRVIVLNFGTLLSEGNPLAVLMSSAVKEAYLGSEIDYESV
jgi:branched-chain amino acid transport system ATP-binding protein